ncbi:MAG: sigma-70 family RNA polymerase sigma factor, partial [Deltaproteobacteria bacterium]|nr:sigma-70 family RNA polymerase sigma factor [Deltaproteobacteria bacterium]
MGTAPVAVREQDLALARRAAGGERAAQRDLFVAQRAPVHHTLFRILGANRELEDLVQDTFVEIYRGLAAFRGDSTLTRWCQTIAARTAYLALNRRKPTAVGLELVEAYLAGDDESRRHAQLREAARRLYAALDRLDPKQRITFALAVLDGCAIAEVAQLTESSTITVKARGWRARKELRKRAAGDAVLGSYLAELEAGADPQAREARLGAPAIEALPDLSWA